MCARGFHEWQQGPLARAAGFAFSARAGLGVGRIADDQIKALQEREFVHLRMLACCTFAPALGLDAAGRETKIARLVVDEGHVLRGIKMQKRQAHRSHARAQVECGIHLFGGGESGQVYGVDVKAIALSVAWLVQRERAFPKSVQGAIVRPHVASGYHTARA